MTVGEAMRQARMRKEISIAELAEKTGISESSIRGFERDKHVANILFVEALADSLGISIDEYIGHKVKKNPKLAEC